MNSDGPKVSFCQPKKREERKKEEGREGGWEEGREQGRKDKKGRREGRRKREQKRKKEFIFGSTILMIDLRLNILMDIISLIQCYYFILCRRHYTFQNTFI